MRLTAIFSIRMCCKLHKNATMQTLMRRDDSFRSDGHTGQNYSQLYLFKPRTILNFVYIENVLILVSCLLNKFFK